MAHQEAHPAVPYDPLVDQPNSPRLSNAPQLHTPGSETPTRPMSAAEFGAPQPGYFNNDTYGNASAASSTNFRGSNYGSIAPLGARDSTFGYPPGGSPTPGGFKDEEGTFANQGNLVEKDQLYAAPRTKTKRKLLWIFGALCGVIVLVAIVVPVVYFTAIKKNGSGSSSSGNSGSGSSNSGSGNSGNGGHHQSNALTWGGDGSTVTKDDGSTFTYNNSLGGYWVYDPVNPLNNSARAQSYSPPLTQDWPWGSQSIYGVNLGGWLVLEPFITPSLYEPFYPNAVDEWTLSTLIQARDGNLNAIEDHYNTFITEEDFAQIAAAGLNWVRIPLPFWAIEVYPGEPFLAKTSWKYFLKAIEWARKYGIRINVDLHAVPGSQNGWNHSGKGGEVNFLSGVMGIANAQRTMDYIRVIAEFISQPEYSSVVPYFGILNEPLSGNGGFPKAAIREFYAEAYRVIRNAGGIGSGHGPYISIHEAFWGLSDWTDFLVGADRLALDHHPYLIFTSLQAQTPESFAPEACANWAGMVSDSMTNFGLTAAGEWSFAINDCGLYVNAVGSGSRYEGTFDGNPVIGSCDAWTDASTYSTEVKTALKSLGTATMDSLGNWFFWTWKIGASSATGRVMSPMWSYQLAIEGGWAPLDPRTSAGACTALGQTGMTWTGPLAANQVGSSTTATPATLASYVWPPDTIAGFESAAQAATLPQYTPTGPIPTLPIPTFTQSGSSAQSTANLGNGWANSNDQTLMAVPVSGCTYPDPWNALTAAIPACGVIGNGGTTTGTTTNSTA